jgi:putative nucleotidyltransferase with HDIG domain
MIKRDITAIVLAAGLSKRMGRFKPLLPLGSCRIIEQVVLLFQAAGVIDIVVVTGYRSAEVRQAIAPLSVRSVENPDYHQGMFSSVLVGLRALPGKSRAFFIHPADTPLVRPQTVRRLMAAYRDTSAAVCYPMFSGRRGHPTLIDNNLNPEIQQWSGAGGLRAFLRCRDADSLDLPVADEAVLLDLDSPEDYRRLQARLTHGDLPSEQECRVLMDEIQNLPDSVTAHSRAVSLVARRLAQALQSAGVALDVELVRTAALLHDIARTRKKDHAAIGADLLEYHGFSRLAPIVRAHMDLDVDPDTPIDEIQVVHLADKLVLDTQRVDLERRFARQIEKFAGTASIVAAIVRKLENARCIRTKVERTTGLSVDAILAG